MRVAVAVVVLVVAATATPAVGATATPTAATTATPAAVEATADRAGAGASTPAADSGAESSADAVIRERVVLDRTPSDPEHVAVTLSYDLPGSVTSLRVDSPYAGYAGVSVASTDGFERRSVTAFSWDGETDAPSIRLRFDVADDDFAAQALGVETDDWAFAYLPDPSVEWRYDGTPPEFSSRHVVAGEGYATSSFGVAGAGTTATTHRVGDVNVTFVVAPGARPRASLEEYVDLYRLGNRELESGHAYANGAAFVLPGYVFAPRAPVGTAAGHHFWMQDGYSRVDTVESTAAHEYVHTRLGTFRGRTGRWLTEASAEYYGRLLSLNAGQGSWSEFRESLHVEREAVARSTLNEPWLWADAYVPYEKGSRVLAALDAEIRERTDGARTLEDVFAYRFSGTDSHGNLSTYVEFADAVVATTDDPSMRDWLDRYVAGNEVPPLPEDPDRFVLNESMDSDGDGLANGEEVATNPFAVDTDDDGVPDDVDAHPTDPSRFEREDEPEPSTTTASTTTAPTTAAPTTTAPATSTATATATTSTATATTRSATTPVASTTTEGEATSAADDAAGQSESSSANENAGPRSTGGKSASSEPVPGFGLATVLLAVLVGLGAAARRLGGA